MILENAKSKTCFQILHLSQNPNKLFCIRLILRDFFHSHGQKRDTVQMVA